MSIIRVPTGDLARRIAIGICDRLNVRAGANDTCGDCTAHPWKRKEGDGQ